VGECVCVLLMLNVWVPVGTLQLMEEVRDWEAGLYVTVDLVGVTDWLTETVVVAETDRGDGVMVGANV